MSVPRRRDLGRDIIPLTPREEREELPDGKSLLNEQVEEAVYRLHEDTTKYPTFPWRDLANIAGPMCPEDLVMVAGRTGGGKSLFMQNLFDALIDQSGLAGLYIGLEQPPRILRVKWACLRAGVNARYLLATKPHERGTTDWQLAMERVKAELDRQKSYPIREQAYFAGVRMIDAEGLREWTAWAVDRGCAFVMLDHIDRVKHGDGRNPFHEMSETVRTAKELASEHKIIMVAASQVGRPGDGAEAFVPPALHNLRGGGTKEEESDTVLSVYRRLKPEVTDGDIKKVRQGFKPVADVLEPHQMGVQLLKHRLDGEAFGKVATLAVNHGRISDLPERDRVGTSFDEMRRL